MRAALELVHDKFGSAAKTREYAPGTAPRATGAKADAPAKLTPAAPTPQTQRLPGNPAVTEHLKGKLRADPGTVNVRPAQDKRYWPVGVLVGASLSAIIGAFYLSRPSEGAKPPSDSVGTAASTSASAPTRGSSSVALAAPSSASAPALSPPVTALASSVSVHDASVRAITTSAVLPASVRPPLPSQPQKPKPDPLDKF
jgi:hypothetical protein